MKLCRLCGKTGINCINIFKIDGLIHKIETCLPIIILPHSLIPETICQKCHEHIENFYEFKKLCLENIIILETKFNITESCLKTSRKLNQSCQVTPLSRTTESKSIQTDDYKKLPSSAGCTKDYDNNAKCPYDYKPLNNYSLVDYDVPSSHSNSEDENEESINTGRVVLFDRDKTLSQFYDIANNILINFNNGHDSISYQSYSSNELSTAGKVDSIHRRVDDMVKQCKFKMHRFRRRKRRQPRKLVKYMEDTDKNSNNDINGKLTENQLIPSEHILPQQCFLCNTEVNDVAEFANHFMEYHIQNYMSQVYDDDTINSLESTREINQNGERNIELNKNPTVETQVIQPLSSVSSTNTQIQCPNCLQTFSDKSDLFTHLHMAHSNVPTYLCGICLKQLESLDNLENHLQQCVAELSTKFYCQICYYGEDSFRLMENHILTHGFLIDNCRNENKNYDPEDFMKININYHSESTGDVKNVKNFKCMDCGNFTSDSSKEFWLHRKNKHSIFHCNLCSKYYKRNALLWKHTRKAHKNHPSITCQICYQISSSKYQLALHFSRMHQNNDIFFTQISNESGESRASSGDNSNQQESITEENENNTYFDDNVYNNNCLDEVNGQSIDRKIMPKEIDRSHTSFTNIITNYTPPPDAGLFKCPKCSKRFIMNVMLKRHKKNCRPKLQEDLLTRCRTCSRIFKDRQSLGKHLVNYHWEYVCEICKQKMESKCEIVTHIRFHHPKNHLICNKCKNILRCQKDLKEHLANHDNSYVCQYCGDSLLTQMRLKMHILSLHRKILSLSCGICLKLFENQRVLKDHVTLVHKNQLDQFTSCKVCGKNYGSKWKTYEHINKSHGSIFKTCKICLELCESESQLEHHFKTIHSEEINTSTAVKSNAINNTVATNESLIATNINFDTDDTEDNGNNTQTSDTEDEDYEENDQSDKAEEKKSAVIDNLKKDPTFSTKARLKKHSKRTVYINSNVPSCCEICRKTWPAKKHLWQHYIRCHKHEAATVCGICLKTNQSYEQLQRHLHDTHPTLLHGQGFGSNFICRICGRYHNASSKLRLHMAIHENFDWEKLLINVETNKSSNKFIVNNQKTKRKLNLITECSNSVSDSEPENKLRKIDTESDDNNQLTNHSDNSEDSTSMSSKETGNTNPPTCSSSSNAEESQESYQNDNHDNDYDDDDSNLRNIFKPKPEELDTAIKSISLLNDQLPVINQYTEEYDSLESANCLNDIEIESAVGSIL